MDACDDRTVGRDTVMAPGGRVYGTQRLKLFESFRIEKEEYWTR